MTDKTRKKGNGLTYTTTRIRRNCLPKRQLNSGIGFWWSVGFYLPPLSSALPFKTSDCLGSNQLDHTVLRR